MLSVYHENVVNLEVIFPSSHSSNVDCGVVHVVQLQVDGCHLIGRHYVTVESL